MAQDRSSATARDSGRDAGASACGHAGGGAGRGRRRLAARAGLVLTALLTAGAAAAEPTRIAVDVATGAILLAQDADAPRRPASLTKLMTAYLAFEALENGALSADDPVEISAHAAGRPPVKLGLRAGERVAFDELLAAAAIGSKNDAATAVAEAVAGSEDAFVARMNATAARLGLSNTRFVNPTGLPQPGQSASARDIALLSAALLRDFPERAGLFSERSARADGRRVATTNPLFGRVAGALGLKTGFTCDAGYSIAALAERDGRRVLAVTMGHADKTSRLEAAKALIEAAFAIPPGEGAALAPGEKTAAAAPDIRACDGRGAEIVATDIPTPVDADLYLAGVIAPPRPLPRRTPAATAPVPEPADGAAAVAALRPLPAPPSPPPPPPPPPLGGWAAFLGAHVGRAAAEAALAQARAAAVPGGFAHLETRDRDGRILALIHGLDQARAAEICQTARRRARYCLALSPARLLNPDARWRR